MRFGNFDLNTEAYELRHAGQRVKVERIPMELLILLVTNRNKLVTRDQIIEHVWGVNHFIDSESAINTAVRKLRRLLADGPDHPSFIETVAGKGYRFTAEPDQSATMATNGAGPNPQAFQAFIRGRHLWNKKIYGEYEKAIESFQQAIDLDAAFAPSYIGLAHCYIMLGIHGMKPSSDVYPRARAAACIALELDPCMAEAQVVLAEVSKGFDWNWTLAEEQYQQALRLKPDQAIGHQWYANLLSIVGRHDEAIVQAEEARRLDPLSVGPTGFVGFTLYRARRFDEALREATRTVEFNPQSPIANWFLAHVHIQRGLFEEAIGALSNCDPAVTETGMHLGLLAFAKARAAQHAEANAILKRLEQYAQTRYISPFDIATAQLGLENHAAAVFWIRKAIDDRVMRVTELEMPLFDEVSEAPELEEFIAQMKAS